MSFHWSPREPIRTARFLLKWNVLGGLVGILSGSASAIFLVALAYATDVRVQHPWLLYFLPLGGCLIGLAYHHWGKECERGNNLILEEIHKPSAGVSSRLAPLVFIGTVVTHLFGGSAGREGTAVQMGGSLAAWLGRRLRMDGYHMRLLLMAGISGGFGSVFGTPIAGTIFGMEVLAVGRMRYDALVPCLVASLVGDWTCSGWGVHHTHYLIEAPPPLTPWLIIALLIASMAFGMTSVAFVELTHWLNAQFKRFIPWAPGRPVVGGLAVIGLVLLTGTHDYLGLGIPLIVKSFEPAGVVTWAFAWKVLFTAVTIASGFKGGEVTPLFCMGATLGCTLGHALGVPTNFLAAAGFVAVFSGAANTPLACTAMGIELFGAPHAIFVALACCSAYVWSGHRGIYMSQMIDTPKTDDPHPGEGTLAAVRQARRPVAWNWGWFSRPSSAVPSDSEGNGDGKGQEQNPVPVGPPEASPPNVCAEA
jgi:H+/Cl- antiporter ClcA